MVLVPRLLVRLALVPLKSALIFAVVLAGTATGANGWTAAAMPESHWQRDSRDPRWVHGQIDLATPAAELWRHLADVRGWPAIFSDVGSFSVKSESDDGSRWVVRFESKIVRHGAFDYLVTLDPGKQSVRVVLVASGVRGVVYATVAPIADRGARVTYTTFAERHGVLGWFVSEQGLRARQDRLVEQNLADLGKAFGILAPQGAGAPPQADAN
jgi:hypothetical protein